MQPLIVLRVCKPQFCYSLLQGLDGFIPAELFGNKNSRHHRPYGQEFSYLWFHRMDGKRGWYVIDPVRERALQLRDFLAYTMPADPTRRNDEQPKKKSRYLSKPQTARSGSQPARQQYAYAAENESCIGNLHEGIGSGPVARDQD